MAYKNVMDFCKNFEFQMFKNYINQIKIQKLSNICKYSLYNTILYYNQSILKIVVYL